MKQPSCTFVWRSDAEKLWLKTVADREGISISALARRGVMEHLSKLDGCQGVPLSILLMARTQQRAKEPARVEYRLPPKCPTCSAEAWQLTTYDGGEGQYWICDVCQTRSKPGDDPADYGA